MSNLNLHSTPLMPVLVAPIALQEGSTQTLHPLLTSTLPARSAPPASTILIKEQIRPYTFHVKLAFRESSM